MARFRALQDSKTLYRKDNPAAIIVQNVTNTANAERRPVSGIERCDLDESSLQRERPREDG